VGVTPAHPDGILTALDVYPGFTGGVYISAGATNGLGPAQVVVGPGSGAAQPVKRFAFQGGSLVDIGVPQANPFPGFTGGMTVAAGEGAMAVGMATGGGTVAVYDGANLSRTRTLSPFGASWTGGVTVAVYGDFLA